MTIEIIQTQINNDPFTGQPTGRTVTIIITNGGGAAYLWARGGLPLAGNLQTILEAEEADLFAQAAQAGRPVDLYELATKRVLKAFALVVLDELNILRTRAGLAVRTAGQIDDAIKAKLKVI